MGYAEVRAAEMNLEKVRAECKARLEQAEAEFRAELPFLGDDIFILISAELDITMLGRARRVQRGSSRQSHMTYWYMHHSVHAVLAGRGARPTSIVAPPHASTAQRSGPFSRATGLPW